MSVILFFIFFPVCLTWDLSNVNSALKFNYAPASFNIFHYNVSSANLLNQFDFLSPDFIDFSLPCIDFYEYDFFKTLFNSPVCPSTPSCKSRELIVLQSSFYTKFLCLPVSKISSSLLKVYSLVFSEPSYTIFAPTYPHGVTFVYNFLENYFLVNNSRDAIVTTRNCLSHHFYYKGGVRFLPASFSYSIDGDVITISAFNHSACLSTLTSLPATFHTVRGVPNANIVVDTFEFNSYIQLMFNKYISCNSKTSSVHVSDSISYYPASNCTNFRFGGSSPTFIHVSSTDVHFEFSTVFSGAITFLIDSLFNLLIDVASVLLTILGDLFDDLTPLFESLLQKVFLLFVHFTLGFQKFIIYLFSLQHFDLFIVLTLTFCLLYFKLRSFFLSFFVVFYSYVVWAYYFNYSSVNHDFSNGTSPVLSSFTNFTSLPSTPFFFPVDNSSTNVFVNLSSIALSLNISQSPLSLELSHSPLSVNLLHSPIAVNISSFVDVNASIPSVPITVVNTPLSINVTNTLSSDINVNASIPDIPITVLNTPLFVNVSNTLSPLYLNHSFSPLTFNPLSITINSSLSSVEFDYKFEPLEPTTFLNWFQSTFPVYCCSTPGYLAYVWADRRVDLYSSKVGVIDTNYCDGYNCIISIQQTTSSTTALITDSHYLPAYSVARPALVIYTYDMIPPSLTSLTCSGVTTTLVDRQWVIADLKPYIKLLQKLFNIIVFANYPYCPLRSGIRYNGVNYATPLTITNSQSGLSYRAPIYTQYPFTFSVTMVTSHTVLAYVPTAKSYITCWPSWTNNQFRGIHAAFSGTFPLSTTTIYVIYLSFDSYPCTFTYGTSTFPLILDFLTSLSLGYTT